MPDMVLPGCGTPRVTGTSSSDAPAAIARRAPIYFFIPFATFSTSAITRSRLPPQIFAMSASLYPRRTRIWWR
jgi:hypothetical protein